MTKNAVATLTTLLALSILSACGSSSAPLERARASVTSIDGDGDGVTNAHDECPEVIGTVETKGCADADADMVSDSADQCPDVPEDRDRFEDEDGCPDRDNDGDGLADSEDLCPHDAEDRDGFEDEDGCPDLDNDRDSVPDDQDLCPNEGMRSQPDPDALGCTATGPYRTHRRVFVESVRYAQDSAWLRGEGGEALRKIVRVLSRRHDRPNIVRIEGHASPNERRAMALSRRRVFVLMRALRQAGIPFSRVRGYACGANIPADSSNSDAEEANRRVEFHVLDPVPRNGVRTTPEGQCIEVTRAAP